MEMKQIQSVRKHSNFKSRFKVFPVSDNSFERQRSIDMDIISELSENSVQSNGTAQTSLQSELPILDHIRRQSITTVESNVAPSARSTYRPFLRLVSFFTGDDSTSEDAEMQRKESKAAKISRDGPLRSSLRYSGTLERLPKIENYRLDVMSLAEQMKRPSMTDLLRGESRAKGKDEEAGEVNKESSDKDAKPVQQGQKFGWVKGVMIRCFLNILGVMLFLRLSWMTGQAGIGLATVIVLLSTLVSILTALSICAICTNGEVYGGGVYFLLSRSLGPEFGGSVGIIFSFANAVAVAMHVVGFSETVRDIIKESGSIIVDNGVNDVRIIGCSTVSLLLFICLVGLEFEAIMQVGLMFILSAALANYYVGAIIPPTLDQRLKGITGFSATTFVQNFGPQYRDGYDFIKLFSIFFPSVTGISAGANISGDLADPQKAIPKGTLLAILLTDLIYISVVWFTGSTCVRDASGNLDDYLRGNLTACEANFTCEYGLMNDYQVMARDSGIDHLISAGIFAATLSSALACLVSAPKLFQAVCKDKLFPYIGFLGKGYGKSGEPKLSYVLTFAIAVGFILMGELNSVSPVVSNFYLASYSLINFACFYAAISNSPGFRPSFKYFNSWTGLAGAILCLAVMFIMSWQMALVTYVIIAFLYLYLNYRQPDVNWGSSTQANLYKYALTFIHKLNNTAEHVKTYRPQILVLTGNPVHRPSMVDFVGGITKDTSLMVCGHVIYQDEAKYHKDHLSMVRSYREQILKWFKKRHVKSFYQAIIADNFERGVDMLVQTAGIGKLRPNVLVIGFKNNWQTCPMHETTEYFNVILNAFESNLAVAIFRLSHGLDYSDLVRKLNLSDILGAPVDFDQYVRTSQGRLPLIEDPVDPEHPMLDEKSATIAGTSPIAVEARRSRVVIAEKLAKLRHLNLMSAAKQIQPVARIIASRSRSEDVRPSGKIDLTEIRAVPDVRCLEGYELRHARNQICAAVNQFQTKAKRPTIDIWWLFDDGGLTLLIPYLLRVHKSFAEGADLRVFTPANSRETIQEEQRNMATLLRKFRIQFAEVVVIPDLGKKPKVETAIDFDRLINKFMAPKGADQIEPGFVSEAEVLALKTKTYRQLRTRELLMEYSMDADLIVLTLPVPRKGVATSSLYLAWLDFLTRNMPPVLLIRGNQQSVLTFYS